MSVIVIVLSVFLFLAIVGFVVFVIYHVTHVNDLKKTIKKHEESLQNKDDVDRQCIGVSIKPRTQDIKEITRNLDAILTEIQLLGCESVKEEVKEYKDAMFKAIDEMKNDMDCTQLQSELEKSLDEFAKNEMPTGVDSSRMKDAILNAWTAIIKSSCTNGILDKKKLKVFADDIFGSICYNV